ncbi:unnamed protein product, partial [Owenia fusiformis]
EMLLYHSMLLVLLAVTLPGHNDASTVGPTTAKATTLKPTTMNPTPVKPTTGGPTTTSIIDICPKGCRCPPMGIDKVVNCSGAMLQDVPIGIPNDTTILDLSFNNITKLIGKNSALANLSEMRLLYIKNNALNTIEAGAFEGCRNLSEIHFNNNILSNNGIQPGVFNDTADEMGNLYFEGNEMNENISAEMFKGIKSIVGLFFSNNSFTVLKRGMFKYTNSLKVVTFVGNQIKTIEDGVWNDITSLTSLDLSLNDFSSLSSSMFKGLINLDQLSIQSCSLVNGIEDGAFEDIVNLSYLILENNGLSKLSPNLFIGLAQLTELWLSGNAIEAIDGMVFQYSPSLETVLVNGNSISQVTGSIQNLTKLKLFDLKSNNIKTLRDGFFPNNVTTNLTIDLTMNPLHCNCFLNWIGKMPNDVTVQGICETPHKVSGRDISKVGKSEFVCYKPTITSMTDNLTVSAGSNVTVSCSAEGDPLPTIIWQASKIGVRKVIGPPSDDSLLSNDGSLTITNFSQAYEGNYTCSAISSLTSNSSVRTLTIRIGSHPSSSTWNLTYGQFVGSVIGAVLGTFVLTVVVFLIIQYFRSKRRAGYEQSI